MNVSSDSEPEEKSSNFVPNKVKLSNIYILNVSSDSGSETEPEESNFARNKIFLPKLTDICSLTKIKVKFN